MHLISKIIVGSHSYDNKRWRNRIRWFNKRLLFRILHLKALLAFLGGVFDIEELLFLKKGIVGSLVWVFRW